MTVELSADGSNWTDITKWIAYQGVTFSRNDIEAPDSGRTLDGLMHRGRVAVKEKMKIKTVPMNKADIATLHGLLYPETIKVRVTPYPGTNSAKTMDVYSNNVETNYIIHRTNNDIQSMSFPLIEV